MEIIYKTTRENINWQEVSDILRRAGLSDHTPEEQEIIFTNSYAVVFVYDGEKIVGVSRALSDGVCQAAVYNVALDEEYHGRGIGGQMIARLMEQLKGQNIVLYTNPPNVALYEKFGFRRSKTSMCLFVGTPEHLAMMEEHGFMLPEGYRFPDEQNQHKRRL